MTLKSIVNKALCDVSERIYLYNIFLRIYFLTTDLEEIGVNEMNWVDLAHDWKYWSFLVNVALNLRTP